MNETSATWECPLCRCSEVEPLFRRNVTVNDLSFSFTMVHCRRCDLYSLQPRPQEQDLLALYPANYRSHWSPLEEESNPLRRWEWRRHYAYRCQAVRRAQPNGGRVLDVGCGSGGFLRALCQDNKWEGMGIDINPYALDIARRQGVNVQRGTLEDVHLPADSFDAVTLWDVIEHVPGPCDTLSEIRRILKPNGRLLLSAPSAKSWQIHLWRNRWVAWETPRHLQIFSMQTLHRLAGDTGFEIVRQIHFPMERFYVVESVHCWLQDYTSGHVRGAAQQLMKLVGWAWWPFLRFIDYMPFASSIALEARVVSE